ncbi:MAG: hypothetical protein JRJ68_04645 [Deltaproteobacteria bacterium]|nr:hypothetical protein [Deltaproteobacteria bacterium]
MAFICTGGYLADRQDFGLEILAVPVVKGKTACRPYISCGHSQQHGISDEKLLQKDILYRES